MNRHIKYYGEIESRKGHVYLVYWNPRNYFVWASLKNHSLILKNVGNYKARTGSDILKTAKEMIESPEFQK